MKKVAFILKGYPRVSETFIAQEIHLLETLGFAIEILSLRQPREPERQPIVARIRAAITYFPEYLRPRLREVLARNIRALARNPGRYLPALALALRESARELAKSPLKRFLQAGWLVGSRGYALNGVGHLHSHFAHAPTELAYYLSRLCGIPYSISAHAKDVYTLKPRQVRDRVRAAKLLMTCTAYNAAYLRGIRGIDPAKIHLVYHGIDLAAFSPSSAPAIAPGSLMLVSVGRLVAKKGYEHILEALQILKRAGVGFTYDIYGTGELEGRLIALAQELDLTDAVRFHGLATQPAIVERLARKGIFVSGSQTTVDGDRDGIPNTIAEAMAAGLPIVATRVSGIPELVEDGVQGLLVPEKDPVALARAIRALAGNPERAEAMGRAGRARVTRMFDSHRCIDACAALFRPLLASGSEP